MAAKENILFTLVLICPLQDIDGNERLQGVFQVIALRDVYAQIKHRVECIAVVSATIARNS